MELALRIKRLIFILAALFAVFMFVQSSGKRDQMAYDGYCLQTRRILSDAEKCRAALSQSFKRPVEVKGVDGNNVNKRSVIYDRTPEEIIAENPDYCRVYQCAFIDCKPEQSTDMGSTEFLRHEGRYAGHVRMSYPVHYKDKEGVVRDGTAIQYGIVNNCGKFSWWW